MLCQCEFRTVGVGLRGGGTTRQQFPGCLSRMPMFPECGSR